MKSNSNSLKIKKVETKIKNPARVDLRRKQIIQGAIKIFIAKGFHNARVREIAEASGMTEGTLYNYIRSKEDIIYIVYDYITGILRDDLMRAIDGVDDPTERLRAAISQNLDTINHHQDIIMFMYTESASLDKPGLHQILSRETEYIEIFESLLRDHFRGRKINEVRLKLAADLLSYIPVITTMRRWSLKRRIGPIDTLVDEILDFVLHGIEFVPEP